MNRKTVEQHRLALFGRLIMGVSHEVDNHLSVVLGFAELIQISAGAEKKAVEGASKILLAGEKISAIVKQFSQHVRPHEPVRESFVPADVLKEILVFARYDLCRGNVELDVPGTTPRDLVVGDRRDFGLAVLALLMNGAEAMAGRGGTLRLEAARREAALEIAVSDEGSGIPPGVMPRIFEEGFGTKGEPYNAGMGLPVARHIAAGMGGTLVVAGRPAGGCVATLAIPIR